MRRHYATFGLGVLASFAASPGVADSKPTVRSVPEYAPVQSVILSEDLFNYEYRAVELATALVEAGAEVIVATPVERSAAEFERLTKKWDLPANARSQVRPLHLPHDNIWIRDYAPIPLVADAGTGPKLGLADLRVDGSSKANDAVPVALGKLLGAPVVQVPVFLDGGNFLVAGDLCITTNVGPDETIELQAGPLALKKEHGKALGCREVLVLNDPPHPHLDMWAKVVGERKILVNEIDPATMRLATELGSDYPTNLLRDSLDRMAAELSLHLEVVRIPMPLPYRGVFRTYTNSLLVNGLAVVPYFRKFGWGYDEYPDAAQLPGMERRVSQVYETLGFRVRLINADGMIYNGGAFHCVTSTLPKLDSKTAKGN